MEDFLWLYLRGRACSVDICFRHREFQGDNAESDFHEDFVGLDAYLSGSDDEWWSSESNVYSRLGPLIRPYEKLVTIRPLKAITGRLNSPKSQKKIKKEISTWISK